MPAELSKTYDPKAVETKWYGFWKEGGYFHAPDSPEGEAYCIVIPPPNVTGALHMGHALNNTLQDILIRWKRMSGCASLWQPGTDHAGIATQNVVERDILKTEKKRRHEIGREALIDRIWKWKELYGNRILVQLEAMGCSCDWERTRFTLDEGLSKAVRECFVRLYEEGLIYRGKYIVNWCPRCRTALADDEVDHKDEKGHLWHIRYPLRDSGSGTRDSAYIVVATTRPETMLGDTAVAVNPKDERYAGLIGKMLHLPETNREIPIVADDFVDAAFGTGAVKVTPAHDPNDFQIGERHNLPRINVMNADATMSEEAGAKYAGMTTAECRKKIVEELDKAGLLEKVEDHAHAVGHCYRCHTTIEPWLSDQWFVKMKPLAEAAIRATEEGKVRFHPERWESFYLQWLENARDWCISRQIWWGHRIPVWYCTGRNSELVTRNPEHPSDIITAESRIPDPDSRSACPPIVARDAPKTCPHCGGTSLVQDEDVLDTWFSSWLWPFSTLGWPEKTPALKNYYPTATLSTDRGIIYFWVARMVMAGLKFMGDVPFRDVYIHGTILDEQGRKMSKSLGNGIDPIDVIEKHGADAMRFSLVVLSTEGQDLKLSESKFEMGRNFCNKLWNASRFAMMNLEQGSENGDQGTGVREDIQKNLSLADKWILSRLQETTNTLVDELTAFRFSVAAQELYRFVWNDFCDWYLEAAKLSLGSREQGTGNGDQRRQATQHTLRHALSEILKLCHPFLPFITEEIWGTLNSQEKPLIVTNYPTKREPPFVGERAAFESIVKEAIEAIRNIRGESNVAPGKRIPQTFSGFADEGLAICAQEHAPYVQFLARVDKHTCFVAGKEPPETKKAATAVTASQTVYVPMAGLIDVDAEVARLAKEISRTEAEIASVDKKLANGAFVDGAPAEIVDRERARASAARDKLSKLNDALAKVRSLV